MTHTAHHRILIATPRFFPYMGGVENHVFQVARRLVQAGCHVTVASSNPERKMPQTEVLDGVEVKRFASYPRNSDWYFAPGVYRLTAEGGFDVIHIQNYLTFISPLAMAGALRGRVPYVVTFHGGGHTSTMRNRVRGLQRSLLRPFLAKANRLIATARFEIPLFKKALGVPEDRFAYIPNGCDIHIKPVDVQTQQALILSVGRLEGYKGHHRVISAMPYVLRQKPNARLRVVGDGPAQAELKSLAERLGVAEAVDIRGVPPTDRQKMAETLASASLITLLSEYETHPMAMLEAIALGRSVLVADTAGLSELATDGLARAIPISSSPSEVGAAIVRQLDHPVRPKQVQLPTWDDCVAGLLQVYADVKAQGSLA
jgi:glycosyltransferase involved in cell wall biosynthesis